MAKEFDIYLNKRLTECDIIVYSIPFRDGLTATNRMILESCLESYTLQKFIAVETGSELVSHIDKMIKTCNERLHMASTWGIDLEFQTHYVLNPVPTVIEIAPNDDLQTLRNMFLQAVLGAEREFGSGTGKLKLSSVYDKFCERFPWLAKVLPFETFSKYVDDALSEMKDVLKQNSAIASIVEPKEGEK